MRKPIPLYNYCNMGARPVVLNRPTASDDVFIVIRNELIAVPREPVNLEMLYADYALPGEYWHITGCDFTDDKSLDWAVPFTDVLKAARERAVKR